MTSPLTDVMDSLSWSMSDFDPEYPDLGALIDSGWGLGPSSGFVGLDEQTLVQQILLNLTERVAGRGAEADAFLQDVFAAAAATLTGAFGRPDRTLYGEEPQLWWQRPATMFGLLTRSDSVSLQLTPSELTGGEWE
ncbi:hypothetical protein ACWT_3425 [Actinoplanes sp. SE50]|uniref:DUF6301 family protein n=1 Tax=unclassified Actinoplanes TaxID=2626549 RepID=UPI00023ED43D|nr:MULTISPECIES: DUF6301 family protein [unclassified Actinoplanes]AEV84448.1 hypothetical protein ACPL_3553 [Actinoplanes sp. SE50/110]ATO82840.1 hypothetical protein ACWT_3425 [Actinoplanes sp. SE50]SLM00248.1 hypothetical protein ACSP50_3480 [Actinoplanes sp. SE50/110]